MPIKYSQALVAALALIAAPAFAQDSTPAAPAEQPAETAPQPPAAEAPAAEAPATETPAADAPATGAPATEATAAEAPAAGAPAAGTPAAGAPAEAANGEPQLGQYYVKETTQDWTTRCIKTDQAKDPCELYQLMKDADGNSVAEMTLIPLKNGDVAAGATLVAPLETDLIEGLGFAVDGGKANGYPFSFCAPVGCVSRMGFTAAELSGLKRGSKVTVSLRPFGSSSERPIQLSLSLKGFTAAFDALDKYADEVTAAQPAAPAAELAPATEEAKPAE